VFSSFFVKMVFSEVLIVFLQLFKRKHMRLQKSMSFFPYKRHIFKFEFLFYAIQLF